MVPAFDQIGDIGGCPVSRRYWETPESLRYAPALAFLHSWQGQTSRRNFHE